MKKELESLSKILKKLGFNHEAIKVSDLYKKSISSKIASKFTISTYNSLIKHLGFLAEDQSSIRISNQRNIVKEVMKNNKEELVAVDAWKFHSGSKSFPNLEICLILNPSINLRDDYGRPYLFDPLEEESIIAAMKLFYQNVYDKFSSEREKLYFKKLYERYPDKFAAQTTKFFGELKEIVFCNNASLQSTSCSHSSSYSKITINLSGSNIEGIVHEMYHHFGNCFTDIEYSERYSTSVNTDSNLTLTDSKDEFIQDRYSNLVEDPYEGYEYSDVDDEYYKFFLFDEEGRSTVQDYCSIGSDLYSNLRERFFDSLSNELYLGFVRSYESALSYVNDAQYSYEKDSITKEEAAIAVLSKYYKNDAFKDTDTIHKANYNVSKNYIPNYLDKTSRAPRSQSSSISLIKKMFDYYLSPHLPKDISEITPNNIFLKSIFAVFEKGNSVRKAFLEFSLKNSTDFKKAYDNCNAYIRSKKSYDKKRREFAEKFVNSAGRRLDNSNFGEMSEEFHSSVARASLDPKFPIEEDKLELVLKKHLGQNTFNNFTNNGKNLYIPINKNINELGLLSEGNLKHMYESKSDEDEYHRDLSIRTLYDLADKSNISGLNPSTYEDFFEKLLSLQLDDSYYKNIEVCRAVLPLTHNPSVNAYALSTYYDLAKSNQKDDGSALA